jgi:hypothetical protein
VTESDGVWEDVEDGGPLLVMNKLFTSKGAGVLVTGGAALGFTFAETDADDDADCLPLTADTVVGVALREPNVFGTSVFMGGTEAGEEEIVADASSMEPKVTEEPTMVRWRSKYTNAMNTKRMIWLHIMPGTIAHYRDVHPSCHYCHLV